MRRQSRPERETLMPPRTRHSKLLTAAEREQLLAACDQETPDGCRDYAVLALLIDCALRPGEVLQVTCAAVHEYDVVVTTYGHSRAVPLSARASQAFRRYRYQARPQPGQEWEPLFLASDGTPLDLAGLQETVHAAAQRAGCASRVPSLHLLRLSELHDLLRATRGNRQGYGDDAEGAIQ
jgi:integrase/recombinase XerD